MPACALKPADRRRQVKVVGDDLLRNYGRKQFYSVEEDYAYNHVFTSFITP